MIEAMSHPDYKDYNYQKNAGKTGYPKIEVINMGVRGYPRKIAILEKANSNYMCGQCHEGHNRSETFTKIATVSSLIRKMLLTEPAGPSVRSSQLTRSNAGMS